MDCILLSAGRNIGQDIFSTQTSSHTHDDVHLTWDDKGSVSSPRVQFSVISDPLNPILWRKWSFFFTTAYIKGESTFIFDLVCCGNSPPAKHQPFNFSWALFSISTQALDLKQAVCCPRKLFFSMENRYPWHLFTYIHRSFHSKQRDFNFAALFLMHIARFTSRVFWNEPSFEQCHAYLALKQSC